MSKIMFIPDVHLTSRSPASRKEDDFEYRKVQYNKLKWCYDYCLSNNINTIIFEGDLFNNSTELDREQLNEIIQLINSYKEQNIISYTIIGNHDLYYRAEDSNKMLLKTLLYSHTVEHLGKLVLDNCIISGFDYTKPISAVISHDKYNICVGHLFYENMMFGNELENTNLTKEKATLLGYDAYVLGHDHSYYPPVIENTYKVFRHGSLLRGTSKTDNLVRGIKVMVFDDSTLSWNEVEVPHKEGKDVFLEERFIKKQHQTLNVDNILANLTHNEHSNIYDTIKELESSGKESLGDSYDLVIKNITNYLESYGMYNMVGEYNDN